MKELTTEPMTLEIERLTAARQGKIARERVEKCVAWMDEHFPGTLDLVDVRGLVMCSSCQCVFGQIGSHAVNLDEPWSNGGYSDDYPSGYYTMDRWCRSNIDGYSAVALGLNIGGGLDSYSHLQQAWTEYLTTRGGES